MNSSPPDSPAVPPVAGSPAAGKHDLAGWLLIGSIGAGFLFLSAVFAPQRVKLPLITPLVLGAVAGWGLGALACGRRSLPKIFVLAASGFLIGAGEIGRNVETYRRELPALRRQVEKNRQQHDIAGRLDESLLEPATPAAPAGNPDLAIDRDAIDRDAIEQGARWRADEEARLKRLVTFAGYLEHRIPPQWGRWPPPWPELFWAAEILLAATLGTIVAAGHLRDYPPAIGGHPPPASEPSAPITTSTTDAAD
jgi:hypothetical protein